MVKNFLRRSPMRPRVLSVGISRDSPCSVDYGWKGLLACGCFSTVIILDPTCAKVTWAPENYYHDHKNPYCLRLASADEGGVIIIWDVVNASVITEFSEPGCDVVDLQWVQNQHISRDLLFALHSKGKCILWNAQTQMQLWKTNVDESFVSFSMDPFSLKDLLFSGPSVVSVVNNFSLSYPFDEGQKLDVTNYVGGVPNHSLTSRTNLTTKNILHELFSSLNNEKSLSENEEISDSVLASRNKCIKVCYHAYRKDWAVFMFRREIIIVSLCVSQPISTIQLDRTTPSFLNVYCCHQRDVLICLHENGGLSVYVISGLAQPVNRAAPSDMAQNKTNPQTTVSCVYDLVVFVDGSRRSRQSYPFRFSVDRSTELAVAVTCPDGRVQFWNLRSLPLQASQNNSSLAETTWCLSDLLPHEPGSSRQVLVLIPKLCLQMCSMYTASKTDPTVCRVCPQHLIRPIASRLDCHSLVAVGNCRGSVQIWDLHSGSLWRDLQLLPVPVLGVEWLAMPCSPKSNIDGDSPTNREISPHEPVLYTLGLIVHGWQPKDRPSTVSPNLSSTASDGLVGEDTVLEGKNYVTLVNLSTGFTHNFRATCGDNTGDAWTRSGGFGSGTPIHRGLNVKTELTYEGPIELARVSHSGLYLALLIRNECVELWNMHLLKLTKRIAFAAGAYGVALDWYQSAAKHVEFQSGRSSEILALSQDTSSQSSATPQSIKSHRKFNNNSQRESFILCTCQGSLRLIVVDGSDVDSTVISPAILRGLPATSMERISAVAWFADLLAFGTADGLVALRDLHSKRTIIRTSSSSGWFHQPDNPPPAEAAQSDLRSAVTVLTQSDRYGTGVRCLRFVHGSPAHSRLLALSHDSLFVWQPQDMTLLCMARFGGHLQRCLISADWANQITGPADPVLCLIVGADGALRLVQAGESGPEMTPVSASVSNNANVSADQPTTRFYGSSAIPDRPGPLLVPSVLPNKTALTVRHLLQHQPWNEKQTELPPRSPPAADDLLPSESSSGDPPDDLENRNSLSRRGSSQCAFELVCPPLSPGSAKVQQSADSFLKSLAKKPEVRKTFLRSGATIVERCLWTAQLFGDSYEIRFWHVVANRLLATRDCNSARYALDLSWNLLADHDVYRMFVLTNLQLLEQKRTTSDHRNQCIHYLLLLGQHERAITLLLETPPESRNYSVNMYRACLLAANSSGESHCLREPAMVKPVAEDTYLSTIKLVATNFLSSGQLDAGIELLCFIGLYQDACRYLESFDCWERSVWLAKCTLPPNEINKVLRRWAAYLSSSQINRKDFAVLIYVLLDEHHTVLKLLSTMNQHQLAARYLEACLQTGSLSWSGEYDDLYCSIFLEFSKILIKLDHYDSANYYCNLAGKLGCALKNEIDFLLA
ncbi:hypothetical protein P879_01295 [Paragonimus westermani]|uniref:WD repeat-containing protein 11 n=1 Tax=Paragonimus westermani TaxID=34504 RepID=A0A8T0DUX1_9TREM|nr:hypothetical protein P879_01295 [Paragonimus westermani]